MKERNMDFLCTPRVARLLSAPTGMEVVARGSLVLRLSLDSFLLALCFSPGQRLQRPSSPSRGQWIWICRGWAG
jgi:hypothetical protein